MKNSILNHVAILVEDIDTIVNQNNFSSESIGKVEEFPSEGTRELYIGKDSQFGRLLLMQAIGDGPYKRAFEKRGQGLHHIAIDVEDIDSFVDQLGGSGWFLHPKSLCYYKDHRTVYLSRPNELTLIEIHERKDIIESNNYFIEKLDFPFSESRLHESLSCNRICRGDRIKLVTDDEAELLCQFFA